MSTLPSGWEKRAVFIALTTEDGRGEIVKNRFGHSGAIVPEPQARSLLSFLADPPAEEREPGHLAQAVAFPSRALPENAGGGSELGD